MDAIAYVGLRDAFAQVSLTDRPSPGEVPVQRIVIKSWWQTSTSAGITLSVTRTRLTVPPMLDLTTVTQAQIRAEDVRGQIKTLTASVLAGATQASCSIRHVLVAGDFSLGEYRLTGLVSADGLTWYPTEEVGLVVEE